MSADVCLEMAPEEKAPMPSFSDSDLGDAGNHYYVRLCPDQVLKNVLENVLCFLKDRPTATRRRWCARRGIGSGSMSGIIVNGIALKRKHNTLMELTMKNYS